MVVVGVVAVVPFGIDARAELNVLDMHDNINASGTEKKVKQRRMWNTCAISKQLEQTTHVEQTHVK